MTDKLSGWLNSGTIVTLVSTAIAIGSFVGVSNYRAAAQEEQIKAFRKDIGEQLREFKSDTGDRFAKIEGRLTQTDADGRETARLEEQNRQLQYQLTSLKDDLRVIGIQTQNLARDLAVVKAGRRPQTTTGDAFSDMHQDRKDRP